MIPILTTEEMAAVDAEAKEPVEVLIERAGEAVARKAITMLGGTYGKRVIVVAGKGNNGADGRAAARRLSRRGVRVEVFDAEDAPHLLPIVDLVIDAAYGTGFRGEYRAPHTGAAKVLAVDIPSGVNGDTGEAATDAVRAAVNCYVRCAQARPAHRRRPRTRRHRGSRRHRSRHLAGASPIWSRPRTSVAGCPIVSATPTSGRPPSTCWPARPACTAPRC